DALLSRALIIGVGAGLAIIVLQPLIFAGAFWLSPASPEVESLARQYIQIRVWSAPAAIALFGITGWLIAAERTKAVLVLQLWMNGLNILLSIAFVIGLGWGIKGVAFSSFIAEWAGLGVGLWFCRGAFARPFWREWPRVLNRARLIAMAAVNRDILLRSLMLQAIFVSFLFFGADFGDVPLAANQVLLQFLFVTSYALDGFAFAAETLVGNAMGAKNRARLRRAAVLNSLWAGGIMVGMAICIAIFGAAAIDLMTTSDEVRLAAKTYLPWVVAAPVVGLASWMLDGIFIGATRTVDMRNMAAISAVIYFSAVWALTPTFENHGLWMALMISFIARGVTLALRYPALERAVAA
ncbi:MAG: MATE family efflux transporter, partial [Paracoccaceae bacterium]